MATIYGATNGPAGYAGRPCPALYAGDGFDGRMTSPGHKAADAEAFMANGGVAALLADLRERVVLQRPRDVVRFILRDLGAPVDGDARAARQDSAEDFSRLGALLFTAMAWIFIPAYCFAVS